MPQTTSLSTAIKGMNQDNHTLNNSNDTYPFAYNSVIEDYLNGNIAVLSNEQSNKCSVEFPKGYYVVGFKEIIEQKRTIYFLHNPISGISQIGEVYNCTHNDGTDKIENTYCTNCNDVKGDEMTPLEKTQEECNCLYRIILFSTCLNFSIGHPVDIEYKLTDCSLQLYFTDDINERRFIYFNYIDNDVNKELVLQDRFKFQSGVDEENCNTPIYSSVLDCNKIKVHPEYNRPCPQFISFVNGGNLKAGVYQILVSYADAYGNPMSIYFPASQIAPLFERELTFETNYTTSKALHFKVNNLDTSSIYKYYNVVIAQTIDSFTEFIHVATLPISQSDYIYTGYEKALKRLDPTEVLFERPFYKTAASVTKANDYLFFGGVKEYPILNLQPVANAVKLQWQTMAVKEGIYRKPENVFKYRTYQRDEVYSFGIVFEFANGRETQVFHIPGRAPNPYDLENVTPNDDYVEEFACEPITSCNRSSGPVKKRWEVYNTATVIGTPHEESIECEDGKVWEYGDFAYWESTERYPNIPEVWGDLCGQCIRHHKFPDSCVTHIHDGYDTEKPFNESNFIFPIGVKVDHQSVIDALDKAVLNGIISYEDRQSIKSYRIVRGNRVGQKSVIAKGLIYNMLQDNSKVADTGEVSYFPNYPYNDLNITGSGLNRGDAFLKQVDRAPKTMFTFHSPDVHFVNSSIGSVLKLETLEYGFSEGYFTYSECQAKHKFLSQLAYILSFGLGLAAAISATGEKECKTITYKSDRIDSHPPMLDGSTVPGTPWLTTVATPPVDPTTGLPNGVSQNNGAYSTYDPKTGAEIPYTPGVSKPGAEQTITTCTGQPFQLFVTDPKILVLIGGANDVIQRVILALFEMQKVIDTILSLLPEVNLSAQYNSVGNYNNYLCTTIGNKVRNIQKSAYLTPHVLHVDQAQGDISDPFEKIVINNWNRESSVYIKVNKDIDDPSLFFDSSKVSMRDVKNPSEKIDDFLNRRFYTPISSYYTSIKNPIANQYGSICNINYLETSGCSFYLENKENPFVFGGDTFINRFALKRKMPFFLQTRCKFPDNSDVLYRELGNVGEPRYWFNTPEPVLSRLEGSSWSGFDIDSIISILTTHNSHEYDIHDNKLFYQKGLITLFNYGIPYFLVESDINIDYRTAQNREDKDFYPHNTDLKRWLEEENVPISTDNTYYYNNTYSKQNHENTLLPSCIKDYSDLTCQFTNYNRVIYSENSSTENKDDHWLIFKANNYYDFDLTKGKLISVDGIEDDKVLVRLEKGTQIFNAYDTLQASGTNIQVGTGGMFKTRPRDIAITDLGYAGTLHKDILHTEFGHIWADSERGNVFNLANGGSGIVELGKDGMRSWFAENLPFEIKKHFPNVNIDNNLNGIGLHYGYDRRFSRFLMTKLDYKPLSKQIKHDGEKFYIIENEIAKEISLNNPKYFCNKSWTISYNFLTKSWVSFHSYKPLFYNEDLTTFSTSIRKPVVEGNTLIFAQKLYTHNVTNKSYQVFYGKLEPFIIEVNTKKDAINSTLNSIEYFSEAIRYHNNYDRFYNPNKTFNKAIIYNDNQCTGTLILHPSNPNDFSESFKYPNISAEGLNILVTNSENTWKFNGFYNTVKSSSNNVPIFLYDCNNVNKRINPIAITYSVSDLEKELIRGRGTRIQFIQDKDSNYKINFMYLQSNQRQSFR